LLTYQEFCKQDKLPYNRLVMRGNLFCFYLQISLITQKIFSTTCSKLKDNWQYNGYCSNHTHSHNNAVPWQSCCSPTRAECMQLSQLQSVKEWFHNDLQIYTDV